MPNTHTQILIEWQAAAKVNHVRSEKWYVVNGLLCATLVAYGVLSGSWALSITFGMIAGLYFLTRNDEHKAHVIRIFEYGIEFDGTLHSWSEWENFWILRADNYYELHMAPVKPLRPELVVQTGDADPFVVRDIIAQYVPQIGHQKERVVDAFIRFCKL